MRLARRGATALAATIGFAISFPLHLGFGPPAAHAQEIAEPSDAVAALSADQIATGERLAQLKYLSGGWQNKPAALERAIARWRNELASTAAGPLIEAERALLERERESEFLAARAALREQLQQSATKRQLVAAAVLNATVEGAPLEVLRTAAQTFRKAIASAAVGPLTEEEQFELETESKALETFAGLEPVKYPKRDLTIVLPLKLVAADEVGDSDHSWLTYRSADEQISIDYFSNSARASTTLSLASALLEKRVGMNFEKLDLSGEEFVIEGSVDRPGGDRGLLIMRGRAREKDVVGHGIRTSAEAPANVVMPQLRALALPPADLPFASRVAETEPQRKWRVLMHVISNLIESDFLKHNGYEFLALKDCRGVEYDRARLRKTVNIVYATGRAQVRDDQPVGPVSLGQIYGSDGTNVLSIGCLKVSIVAAANARTATSSSVSQIRSEATALEDAGFQAVLPAEPYRLQLADRRRYAFRADERVAQNHTERGLLFIHGYNNSFETAIQRAAQLAAASNYDGFVYVFSWPSQGQFASYAADMDFAEASEPELVTFMKMILTAGVPMKLDVIAHSMGSQIFLRSLEAMRSVFDMRVGDSRHDRARFGQLIFAAPDVSVPLFQRKIAELRPFADRVTVYASANDGALDVSGLLRGNLPRAGAIPREGDPVFAEGVHVIDVTGELIPRYLAKRYFYRTHSAFAYDQAVIEDIGDILAQSARGRTARLTPPARARLALRSDKFDEAAYTAEIAAGSKWWKVRFTPSPTVMDWAREKYDWAKAAIGGLISGPTTAQDKPAQPAAP